MKVFVFSDTHFHLWPEFSFINSDGLNSRFASQLEAIQFFRKDCEEGNCDLILFGGDICHLKNGLDSNVLRKVISEFKKLSQIAPVICVSGNHDLVGWSSSPVLVQILEDLLPDIIIPGPDGYKVKGWTVKAFPFVRQVDDLVKMLQDMPEQPKTVALLHQDVIGMTYGAFTVVKGITAQLIARKFAYGLLGHFHGMTKLAENVYIVGSPVELNFGEIGQKKGWIIIDCDSGRIWERENILSPRFHDVVLEDGENLSGKFNATQFDRDYFRIKIKGDKVPDDISAARWRRVSVETKNTKAERGDLKLSDSHDALVRKYVKAKWGGDGNVVETLVELGKKYL